MANCTFIFSRQLGMGIHNCKPNGFVSKAIGPLLEDRISSGKRVHIIHEIIPSLPLSPDLIETFEKLLSVNRFVRDMKGLDKGWRLKAKSSISRMDDGCECDMLSHRPEARTMIDANRRRPGTAVNHLGFYPFESVEEATRFQIMLQKAEKLAAWDKIDDAVGHVMAAHEALAAANLHADIELMRQISMIGEDVIVLRGINHAYLVNLDKYDIPVVDGARVIGFSDLLSGYGISIRPVVEETALTFSERAINGLCAGGIGRESHRELTSLDLAFTGHMKKNGLWDSPDGIEKGLDAIRA